MAKKLSNLSSVSIRREFGVLWPVIEIAWRKICAKQQKRV
jgi:hypothetical protein